MMTLFVISSRITEVAANYLFDVKTVKFQTKIYIKQTTERKSLLLPSLLRRINPAATTNIMQYKMLPGISAFRDIDTPAQIS